jgi:hydrogenase maturation protease
MKRILVAGIGNIFFGDDAFGVEVARELSRQPLAPGVCVNDFGIRSYDLAYAITDGYDAVILVDATPRGEPPGTVSVIEPDLDGLGELAGAAPDAHTMNPLVALQMARTFGRLPASLHLVGCEPYELETDGGRIGLSDIVQSAVPRAIDAIRSLIVELLKPETIGKPAAVPA